MARNYIYCCRLTMLCLTLLFNMAGQAKVTDRYNKHRPLVVVCDWELPPYEYRNDNGEPVGYTIEVLQAIFKRMNVPITFIMLEKSHAIEAFDDHKADVVVAPNLWPGDSTCFLSRNVINYYKVGVAMRTSAPPVATIDEVLASNGVVLRLNGVITRHILMNKAMQPGLLLHSPNEAMAGVSSGKYNYFIWGIEPLKKKKKELNLNDLRITELAMPAAELRIATHDEELANAIDDQYTRLEQSGTIAEFYDKWFRPELMDAKMSQTFIYVTIAVIGLLLMVLLINRLAYLRVKKTTQREAEQKRLMEMALDMGGMMVVEYDPKKNTTRNIRGTLATGIKTSQQVIERIHPDDRQLFLERYNILKDESNSVDTIPQPIRWNNGTLDHPHWLYLDGHCIKELNHQSTPTFVFVAKDTTKTVKEHKATKLLGAKYLQTFNKSMVAMSFYDKDGMLIDLNERMKEIIGFEEQNQKYFFETPLFDFPLLQGVVMPELRDVVHVCQHMYYPDVNLDKYLEFRICPVIDNSGEVIYFSFTVVDITDARAKYKELGATEQQLQAANEEIKKFEQQLSYLLNSSKMLIWHSNHKEQRMYFSRSLQSDDFFITYDEYMSRACNEEKEKLRPFMADREAMSHPINHIRYFSRSPLSGEKGWIAVSGTPIYDNNGIANGHFGVMRDVTKLMEAQEELRRETARAEQSGQLKTAFLANMTHEIRTPLNAIVGFSDLLQAVDTKEERTEFVHIIRNNCDMLMRLIDDLVESSKIDDKSDIDIKVSDVDFAVVFNEMCQTLEQRVQQQIPGVAFVKENPFTTYPVRTDHNRVQQVLTNFVTNAIKYTKQGSITVGYREEDDGIYLYCTDTGAGIPKEKQSKVFDRFVKLNEFVQGTGLGLSICKTIAERFGGRIGMSSEGEGKGSTFWFWMPRYL